MEVSSIEKYPRYIVEIEHEEDTYLVHISEDMIEVECFITNADTYDELPRHSNLYRQLLDHAYTAIRAEKESISREDLLKIASIANPGVMSTPGMMHERLAKIDLLIKEMLQTTKIA